MSEEQGLIAFGHGLFQKCSLKPLIIQTETIVSPNFLDYAKNVLLLNQALMVGVEVVFPHYERSVINLEQIIQSFQEYADCIEFNCVFTLLDSESQIFGESTFTNTLQNRNEEMGTAGKEKSYLIADNRIVFFRKSSLKLAQHYVNKLLRVSMSLSIISKQGRHINPSLYSDVDEANLRYLLDQNRCRPAPVPPLLVSLGVEVKNRIRIKCSVHELDSWSTLALITVENNFNSNRIVINNCTLHMERTLISGPETVTQWLGNEFSDLFTIDRLSSVGDEVVVINPQDSFNLSYKISVDPHVLLKSGTSLISSYILGFFSTPFTIFYSTAAVSKLPTVGAESSPENYLIGLLEGDDASHAPTPMQSTLHWSMGTKFASSVINKDKQENFMQLTSSFRFEDDAKKMPDREGLMEEKESGQLDALVEWPEIVRVDETFILKFSIINRSPNRTFRDLVLVTALPYPNANFVIQESAVKIK